VTVLIASHDITLIDDMNRRTLRLDQGQLVADGRPRTEVNRG